MNAANAQLRQLTEDIGSPLPRLPQRTLARRVGVNAQIEKQTHTIAQIVAPTKHPVDPMGVPFPACARIMFMPFASIEARSIGLSKENGREAVT
jgi:hypothetical protein